MNVALSYLYCRNQLNDPLCYFNYENTVKNLENRFSKLALMQMNNRFNGRQSEPDLRPKKHYEKYLTPILDDLTNFQLKVVGDLNSFKDKQKIIKAATRNKDFADGQQKIMKIVMEEGEHEKKNYERMNEIYNEVREDLSKDMCKKLRNTKLEKTFKKEKDEFLNKMSQKGDKIIDMFRFNKERLSFIEGEMFKKKKPIIMPKKVDTKNEKKMKSFRKARRNLLKVIEERTRMQREEYRTVLKGFQIPEAWDAFGVLRDDFKALKLSKFYHRKYKKYKFINGRLVETDEPMQIDYVIV